MRHLDFVINVLLLVRITSNIEKILKKTCVNVTFIKFSFYLWPYLDVR